MRLLENLKIVLLLHFYQPWWQFPEVLKRIVGECYRPIMKLVGKKAGFCFSANANYSLLELLDGSSFRDVIDDLKKAVVEQKIEFLGSTAYHPIMPLIPRDLQTLQMFIDDEFKKTRWGITKNCKGIFLPEMAFSQGVVENLKNAGYNWTVLDDVLFKVQYNYVPFDHIVVIENDFKIFLRSNYWSNQIAASHLDFGIFQRRLDNEFLQWTKNQPAYLVVALDAETFGHHHPGLIKNFLEPMIEEWGSGGKGILTPLEKIPEFFPVKTFAEISDGSWAMSEEDYRENNPFPLWDSKANLYHKDLWKLIRLALELYREEPEINLDYLKILTSCHWWWISGCPWWSPGLMKIGAYKAMDIIEKFGVPKIREKAKEIFKTLAVLK